MKYANIFELRPDQIMHDLQYTIQNVETKFSFQLEDLGYYYNFYLFFKNTLQKISIKILRHFFVTSINIKFTFVSSQNCKYLLRILSRV